MVLVPFSEVVLMPELERRPSCMCIPEGMPVGDVQAIFRNVADGGGFRFEEWVADVFRQDPCQRQGRDAGQALPGL